MPLAPHSCISCQFLIFFAFLASNCKEGTGGWLWAGTGAGCYQPALSASCVGLGKAINACGQQEQQGRLQPLVLLPPEKGAFSCRDPGKCPVSPSSAWVRLLLREMVW